MPNAEKKYLFPCQLETEQRSAAAKGAEMGWTRYTPREHQIISAVAAKSAKDRLGKLSIKELLIASGAGSYPAIKITLTNQAEWTSQRFDLSRFWALVGDVETQLGEGTGLVTPKALKSAIQRTFEDNVSGALDERLSQQEGRFHPPYG